jgi:putative CocE/NonD family hydrolase
VSGFVEGTRGAGSWRLRTSTWAAWALGAISLLAVVLVFAAPSAEAATPWAKRITGYLPARDGTMLKYSVLLPAKKGRFPTVMNYSGYDPGSIGGSAYRDGDTTMDPKLDARLLRHGYAIFGVNMAGTACSEGTFRLFAGRWGTDGYDAIEWAAKQPWSDGEIGMANWSYAGLSQLLTATTRPPHLRAIAPGMAVTDPWRDVGFPGGVTNYLFPVGWTGFIQSRWNAAEESAMHEGDSKCLKDLAANQAKFPAVSPAADLLRYPYPEDVPSASWRRSLELFKRTDRINVPVLSLMAWQDEATGPRAGYYQDTLNPDKTYVVGTNGPHDSYESTRWQRLLLRFFNRYLKGDSNGFAKEPHVQLWEDSRAPGMKDAMGGNLAKIRPGEVIKRNRWPVKLKPMRWSLRSHGRLTRQPAGKGEAPDSYSYPIPAPTVNDYTVSGNDQWKHDPPSENGSVAYTTAPLRKTLTFYGSGSLNLWVSSTAPDADIQATVTEVRPDGREQYVQRGWLRLSERAQDKKYSTPLRPFQERTRSAVAPLTNDKPVRARLEITRFSQIFRRSSSIRVWLDTPSRTGEMGFKDPTQPSTIRIYHNANHQSQLVLGLLQEGGIDTPQPACDSVLRQPCRDNPIPVPGR